MKELKLHVGSMDIVALVSEMDENAMIALRPFVERLGLDWASQTVKIRKNPQFNCCDMTTVGSDGKQREMLCIPVKQLGMWLCTVNANKVKPEIKDRLIQFQMHLQVVIHEALTGKVSAERIRVLEENLSKAFTLINQLQHQIAILTGVSGYHASAASYGMHAAKKSKHLRVVN